MKQSFFLALIAVIISGIAFSQKSEFTASEKDEDLFLPTEKGVLNEQYDEAKQNVQQMEAKIRGLNRDLQYLLNYKNSIDNFQPADIEATLNELGRAISEDKYNDRIMQEAQFVDYISSINLFYYPIQHDNEEESYISANFFGQINNIVRKLQNDPLIKQISNYRYSSNFNNNPNVKISTPPVVVDTAGLQHLKSNYSTERLNDIKAKLLSIVNPQIDEVKKEIASVQNELKKATARKKTIINKLNEEETQINDLAIKLGLPLFCATILLLFIVPVIINYFKRNPSADAGNSAAQIGSQNVLLEISTVLLLTMSILILGLSGKIQSDVLGTLIGGISGYVLNRISNRREPAGKE